MSLDKRLIFDGSTFHTASLETEGAQELQGEVVAQKG